MEPCPVRTCFQRDIDRIVHCVEDPLPGVAKGGVAQVMPQSGRLGQVLVDEKKEGFLIFAAYIKIEGYFEE